MRKLLIASAFAFAAAPAFADTLQEITTKGVILIVQGMEIPVNYNADNTFSGEVMGQAFVGKWRIDGDKLCTVSDMQPEEQCTAYPAGKKSGDQFDLEGPMGTYTIKIN
ncbi:hypothetical protein GC169_06650 [bacterium]|nr:hypothetical protein [bacterium]